VWAWDPTRIRRFRCLRIEHVWTHATHRCERLAEATDGIAVVNTNDLGRGLRRIADDLSSYYLLGYYSSGRLDGRFRAITFE
jgi:hypothetical protein